MNRRAYAKALKRVGATALLISIATRQHKRGRVRDLVPLHLRRGYHAFVRDSGGRVRYWGPVKPLVYPTMRLAERKA